MTWNWMIFFLSFSAKPASEIEKSLGKLFMSLMALVFGVSGEINERLDCESSILGCEGYTTIFRLNAFFDCSLLPDSETRISWDLQPILHLPLTLSTDLCQNFLHRTLLFCCPSWTERILAKFAPHDLHSHSHSSSFEVHLRENCLLQRNGRYSKAHPPKLTCKV